MKRAVCILAISILAACGGAGTGTGTDDSIDTSASATARSLVAISNAPDRSFASMLNSVRSVNGAAPVTYDSRLGVAAQRHADDMLAENFFSHTGSDGSTVGTRVTA
ncbi:MAG: CAP domain-containing protein, partial [Paracoccaceae bacterium]|nr:CAP domain-containing protein [Paracoccaceae bacterium]